MKNNRKLIAIAACAAALAVGGNAYTGSLTSADADDVVGAGEVTVSGGTVQSVSYTNDTTDITAVEVVFDGQYAPADTVVQVDVGSTAFTCGEESVDEVENTTTVSCAGTVAITSATATQIAINSDAITPAV